MHIHIGKTCLSHNVSWIKAVRGNTSVTACQRKWALTSRKSNHASAVAFRNAIVLHALPDRPARRQLICVPPLMVLCRILYAQITYNIMWSPDLRFIQEPESWSAEMKCIGLDWGASNWIELNSLALNRFESDRRDSNRLESQRLGLTWTELNSIYFHWIELNWN